MSDHENVGGMRPSSRPTPLTVPGAIFTGFTRAREELNRKRMLASRPAFTDMAPDELLALAESMLTAGRQSPEGASYGHIEAVGAIIVAAAQARVREDELRLDLGGDAA